MRQPFAITGGGTARYLLLGTDLLWITASFYLSYRLLPLYRPWLRTESVDPGRFSEHAWLLLLILPLWVGLAAQAGLYGRTRLAWWRVVQRTLRTTAFGLAGLAVVIFAAKLVGVSRLILFGFCLLYIPVSLAGRWLVLWLLALRRAHIYNVPRVLVVGTRERAREFIRRARQAEDADYCLVGCLDPEPWPTGATVEGVPVLGSTEAMDSVLTREAVDLVVFALPLALVPNASERIAAAVELGLRVVVLPDFQLHQAGYSMADPRVSVEFFLGQPVAVVSTVRWSQAFRLTKRVMDLVGAAVLLVLLSPLLAAIAVAIKLSDPGAPVLYRWRVLGRNHRPITSWKFRTMVPDADRRKADLASANEMNGPVFKMRNDPRVTRLGRWLRRYSLDELPQLVSVLRGDLSLVGPRPPFPEEAARFAFWQRRKLSVKPGLTCLWQINGRNEIRDFDHWVQLDLEYIRRASLGLDCWILLKTIPAVLRGRGAY
ncbi:MAG: sugar transferase [Firmicutes bacterium]|nr:sugar transferase [Bacillota bacterium]